MPSEMSSTVSPASVEEKAGQMMNDSDPKLSSFAKVVLHRLDGAQDS